MMPPSPTPDEAGGDPTLKEAKPASYGHMLAVYAERVRPAKPDDKPLEDDVHEAMAQAVDQSEESVGMGPPLVGGDGEISIGAEALPSEVIDASDFVEDRLPAAEADETPEENLEGREFSIAVDNSGMREQFLAAGGIPSDAPPPPVETNTTSSMADLKRKDILGRLKTEYGLELDGGDSMPIVLLNRIEGMVFNDTWPTGEDDTRRSIKLLLTSMDAKEYAKSELFAGELEAMKKALKDELEKRRNKKSGENQPGSKKRKGPPPFPTKR